jgi:hypothetical protein
MLVCVKCKEELVCLRNGVGVDFGGGHIYASDRYGCPKCKTEVCKCNDTPHFDPSHKCHDEYLNMETT